MDLPNSQQVFASDLRVCLSRSLRMSIISRSRIEVALPTSSPDTEPADPGTPLARLIDVLDRDTCHIPKSPTELRLDVRNIILPETDTLRFS